MPKTALSFYLDDTGPYGRPPDTFQRFLDFCAGEGVRGESSVILAGGGPEAGLLSRPTSALQETYLEQVRRAFDCGIETNMEFMTHSGLFDFAAGRIPEGAQHEGIWTYEPGVSVATYQDYFGHILDEGAKVGVRFTGVTWPGCGCEACTARYAELRQRPDFGINSNAWQALLNLAKQGKFRGRTVPGFPVGAVETLHPVLKAGDGPYGVYDLSPTAADQFGIWENTPDRVNADYYIAADGRSGRIVELARAGAPYCLFYAHWQGLNPATGLGWSAFTKVVARVKKHLSDQVEWKRPSEITDAFHEGAKPAGGG